MGIFHPGAPCKVVAKRGREHIGEHRDQETRGRRNRKWSEVKDAGTATDGRRDKRGGMPGVGCCLGSLAMMQGAEL